MNNSNTHKSEELRSVVTVKCTVSTLATHEPTVTLWVQWCHVGLMLLKVKSGSLSVFTLPPMTVYCWEAGDLCPEFFTNRILDVHFP